MVRSSKLIVDHERPARTGSVGAEPIEIGPAGRLYDDHRRVHCATPTDDEPRVATCRL
ncbi:hypothetical protein AArcMg_3522 [Natrarchaeobaculum sulfurireducens]|uniref:Uncharacterized protein n=1 Tax=Natrarchaeobaculum sulfurireducens TaxID=2044521 RepID=A0A346PJR2_9EURY|nr:hypothetical protein AArc1_3464 [Natrarchaeobaculum sulfurireducens]AXR83496.1 hypothetical protein AArcMg_3522 [Natrarchaeobaculum sulfurireducens]